MAQINLSDYKNIYLRTAREYVEKISISLNQLSDDFLNKEALNNLHIASHSLKSQSQVMGFKNVSDICLNIEKISDDILNKVSLVDDTFMSLLKDSVDKLNSEFNLIEKGDAETSSA